MIDRSTSVAPLDLTSIFANAQRARQERESLRAQREQMQFNREQQLTDRDFRQRQVEAGQKQQELENSRQSTIDQRGQADARAGRTAQVMQSLAQMSPEQQAQARPYLEKLAKAGQIDIPDFTNPRAAAAIGKSAFGKPEQPLDLEREIRLAGFDPATPQGQAYTRKLLEGKAKGSQTNITIGQNGDKSIGLTTPQETKQQEAVLGARQTLAQLDLVDKMFSEAGGHDKFGGIVEGAGAAIKEGAASLGVAGKDTRQQVALRTKADAALSGLNSRILHDLSGAAINPSEWDRLKKSLPLMEDPPDVRQAKMAAWRENLSIIESQGVDALVNGIRAGKVKLPGEQSRAGAQPAPAAVNGTGATRTVNGETRVWDGKAWVRQ